LVHVPNEVSGTRAIDVNGAQHHTSPTRSLPAHSNAGQVNIFHNEKKFYFLAGTFSNALLLSLYIQTTRSLTNRSFQNPTNNLGTFDPLFRCITEHHCTTLPHFLQSLIAEGEIIHQSTHQTMVAETTLYDQLCTCLSPPVN
jgi:hypothetical protein